MKGEDLDIVHQRLVSAGARGSADIAFYDFAAGAPGARLEGFLIYRTGEQTFGEDLALLARLVADGKLEPQVGTARDWAQTAEAVTELREHRATGKLVLTRN